MEKRALNFGASFGGRCEMREEARLVRALSGEALKRDFDARGYAVVDGFFGAAW